MFKNFKTNGFKKQKGFTLMEILFAITILALMAILLVPKIGSVKDSVKTSGVDTNMRMVTAQLQTSVDRYKSTDAAILESELVQLFQDDSFSNPFTKQEGIKDYSTLTATNGAAIVYDITDNTSKSAVETKWESTKDPNLAGAIVVAAYPNPTNSDNLEVAVYPFDKKGQLLISKKAVITP